MFIGDMYTMHMYDLCLNGTYLWYVGMYVVAVWYMVHMGCVVFMCWYVAVCGKQVEGILSVSDETCLLEVLRAEGALEQDNGVMNTKAQSAKLKNALREAGVRFCCRGFRASGYGWSLSE